MDDLTLISYNARGLRQAKKRRMLFSFLHRNKTDVILLQETHSCSEDEKFWQNEWGGKIVFAHGSKISCGVCVLFSPQLDFTISKVHTHQYGRFIVIDLQILDSILTLVCIYGPNRDDPSFFSTLNDTLNVFHCERIVWAGDFNFVFNLDLDKVGGNLRTNFNARDFCISIMQSYDLVDIWRERNPTSKLFSWSSNITPGIHCRLDFFLISRTMVTNVTESGFQSGIQSDHRFITLSVQLHTVKRGPGFWKFNNSLLLDNAFVNGIIDLVNREKCNLFIDAMQRWELIKFKIRNFCIHYSKQKASERRRQEFLLLNDISKLEHALYNFESPDLRNRLKERRNDLLMLYNYKLQGTILRSRARWVEHGEKNTKYFLNLEKRNKSHQFIQKLINDHGHIIVDHKDILTEIFNFYSSLYTSKKCNPSCFFTGLPNKCLNDDDQKYCEGDLRLDECLKSLVSMANDKAPGTDGLTTNFYKQFWPHIGQMVVDSFNCGFQKGCLSSEQTRGIISLFLKPDKNYLHLSNYRPITLLNTDYKIAAKSIANRLKSVLNKIISPNQTGFLKGKFIGENIRFVLDLIEYSKVNKIPGFLFLLDFEKAFDTVEWSFLQATLNFFNFGSCFKRWVNLFYNESTACVCNNGYSSGFFQIKRGVRQGCPLSPYLFIMCVETLYLKLMSTDIIKGITIDQTHVKILQYADDTIIFLDNSETSLKGTLNLLKKFGSASGLVINWSKSDLFPLGPCADNLPPFVRNMEVNVTFGPVRFLGIYFNHNGDDLFRLNYIQKLSRLKNCLRMWSSRDLTPVGRITLVKSFALSQLVFLFLVLPNPPNSFIKELEAVIYDFIWQGNPDKIRRNVLINDFCNGGLRAIHIESFMNSLKCTWVRRYCDETKGHWKTFFDIDLAKYGKDLLFHCNCTFRDIQIHNLFVKQVVRAWCDSTYHVIETPEAIKHQLIWNNSYIKVNEKIVFDKLLFDKGILYVYDLFELDGEPLTFARFKTKYKIVSYPFTCYWGLINAIPRRWRLYGAFGEERDIYLKNSFLTKALKHRSFSQAVYQNYLNKVSETPSSIRKWSSSFPDISSEDWVRFFKVPWASVHEVKICYFQYRYLHRILPTNRLLSLMGKKESPLCSFCNIDEETLEHLFWNCTFTSTFILDVEMKILNKQFFFSKSDIFFGYQNTVNHPYNFLILYMKYFIFSSKQQNRKPDFNSFFYKLKFALQVEMNILARKTGKKLKHLAALQELYNCMLNVVL